MALCCRQRRNRKEQVPESQEFIPLTPEYLSHVQVLTQERERRSKEFKKRRDAARTLRKRVEAGEVIDDDDPDLLAASGSRRGSMVSDHDEEAAAHEEEEARLEKENKSLEKAGPNKRMEAGRQLSPKYAADFQKHLSGIPLVDIDPYYKEKEVFIVLGRDKTIYRFSAHNALFCLSPFNPIRRGALYTLVHPYFNMLVMVTILTNCVFMAMGETEENAKMIEKVEYVFTAIYTFEFCVKLLARGFIFTPFTYLRDAWNWLDFMVISLAYAMLLVDKLAGESSSGEGSALENVSALRTFRVLRALKTVAVVPGLKTIVGALMEAVINLRDVSILTAFMLSIFALIGLQLYRGSLKYKCVKNAPNNISDSDFRAWVNNSANWYQPESGNPNHIICGSAMGAGKCVDGYNCTKGEINPNYQYTSWDDFFSCMLNSFRIMTQDYWEDLYFITLRANGTMHFFFFVGFILLGSFYLVNLILAIVAMAYNDQQERDMREQMAEENEKKESDEAAAAAAEAVEEAIRMDEEAAIEGVPDEELLPGSETPNEYRSLVSLNNDSAHKNINMKGVQDIREMMDITARARHQQEQKISKLVLVKAKFVQLFCAWTCCPCFLKVQKYLDLFINDAFMELFIMICILFNTVFMAMEQYPKSEELKSMLDYGNYFFTGVFAFECILKLIALGPVKYFREPWNSFDFVVVAFSIFELGSEIAALIQGTKGGGLGGLSVLRSLRLLRVLKLAKSWKTLNSLMRIVGKALGALGNLTIILGIVIFIFAVCGTQLFAEKYQKMAPEVFILDGEDGLVPRWNFKDFLHAFMIVFRVLCGEWIESMWACMRVTGPAICVPFFLLTFVVGNMVVLNLFLVLLLSSFSADALDTKTDEDDVDKISEAKGRIVRLVKYTKKSIISKLCAWRLRSKGSTEEEMQILRTGNGTNGILYKDNSYDGLMDEKNPKSPDMPLLHDYEDRPERESPLIERETSLSNARTSLVKISSIDKDTNDMSSCADSLDDAQALVTGIPGNPDFTEVEEDPASSNPAMKGYSLTVVEYETLPANCLCESVTSRLPPKCGFGQSSFGQKFWALRCFMFRLVEHSYFETFIIVCILLSSLSLALEDVYLEDRQALQMTLNYLDKIFSGVFICEMLIKWLAFGWKVYFTDAWCWLDFVIVSISITGLVMEGLGKADINAFKAMRTLRALRPLRAVSRWEGMRVVVNALIQAVPSISNVLIVILVFWLIFAIMGVNFFAGKFYKCVDKDEQPLHVLYRNNTDYLIKVLNITDKESCINHPSGNYSWKNSRMTFDHVGKAYVSLLQVATYKGWIEIMADASDSTEVNKNMSYESSVVYYIYFVAFIIFGSFFTLNMFIGVIIENFNAQKKKAGGSIEMFMTDDQKKYYNAMKKLSGKGPSKATPRPKWKFQAMIFDFTMNQKFDVAIMIFIMLNMITMCMEFDEQPAGYTEILSYINIIFIVVFTMEAVLKLLALRQYYFTFPWNIFDFVVVLFSILGLAFKDIIEEHLELSPTVLRVVRVFRVGRVLRLVKSAKGIRTLLFSLLVSLPALFNIGLLLFLIIFIYATFGMAFFKDVEYRDGIDEVFNFRTFFQALITLFQCTTSAGWNGVHAAIINMEDCNNVETETEPVTCGSRELGVIYMLTYLILTFLIIVNMYIAVILENFSQATEDVQQGITQDDIDMYYELWGTYDPKATKYIQVDRLFDLVDELEEPLRVPKPNYFRLVMTDLPVCEGDKIHCNDILDMLTKLFLKQDTDAAANENIPQADPKEKYGEDYNPIYGLLERQRHKWAARFIWSRYIAYREKRGGQPFGSAIRHTSSTSLTVKNEEAEKEKRNSSSSLRRLKPTNKSADRKSEQTSKDSKLSDYE